MDGLAATATATATAAAAAAAGASGLTISIEPASPIPADWVLVASGATVLAAYLLGAIPFGYLVGKRRGVDIRAQGSGNIGATNTARVLGRKWGVIVLLLDALKGFVPVILAAHVLRLRPEWVAAAGVAAFAGHIFPVYLGFKGGKGVATALGVLLAIAPLAALAGFGVYAACYAVWRISSIGSLAALVVVPPVLYLMYPVPAYWVLCGLIVGTILWTHRGNIQRLLARKESKV